jgi:hypothetical protein
MEQSGLRRVVIIPLAQRKIAQRGIPESWVEEALAAPQQVVEGHGGRWIAHRLMAMARKEYLLRVVYEETEDALVVVTCNI